ncbi:MAG: hypothetical protein Q8O92_00215 [Candidatus Latescibacter sp.]|nr:hypothetical protein [Candidatus Latescibacter sp.]
MKYRSLALMLFLFAAGGLSIMSAVSQNTKSKSFVPQYNRLDNFADLYLRGSYDILHMIKVREMGKIGQAAKIAAQRKLAGGKIVSHIGTPHIMYAGACTDDVPGNPNIAPDYKSTDPRYRASLADLGQGDFIIIAGPTNQELRKKGCYFLGVGYPMSTNRYSPPNYNDNPNVPMESQVDMMIYDWAPKEDGLVTPSLTPHLKICPTSPITVVEYWLIMAQIAHNIANKDTSGSFNASQAYIDTLMNRLEIFHERSIAEVNKIGPVIADRVLSGGKIYPWSSRWEFYQEASGTAGSVMGIFPIPPGGFYSGPGAMNPLKLNPDSLTSKDVVILAMAGSTPQAEIEMAQKARAKGVLLIGIYPFTREDGFSTSPLRKLCTVSLNNLSGDRDGVLSIPGYPAKIIPTVAPMNNYAFWSIIGAYVQSMEMRGEAPYYWMSWHVPYYNAPRRGHAYTDSIEPYFLKRGY